MSKKWSLFCGLILFAVIAFVISNLMHTYTLSHYNLPSIYFIANVIGLISLGCAVGLFINIKSKNSIIFKILTLIIILALGVGFMYLNSVLYSPSGLSSIMFFMAGGYLINIIRK